MHNLLSFEDCNDAEACGMNFQSELPNKSNGKELGLKIQYCCLSFTYLPTI